MRLLVTGHDGQLACCLAERARAAADVEIVAVGRPELDLERPDAIRAAVRRVAPDAVINAAAYTAVDQAEEEPRRGLGETYHFAGSGDASWFEFAREIFHQAEKLGLPTASVRPIRSEDWPTRAARPRNSRLDSTKFLNDFGLRAFGWRDSLATVLRRLAAQRDRT